MQKMITENGSTLVMPQLLLGIPNRVGGEEMIKVEDIEAIRRVYFIEGLSIREIARKLHHGRRLVKKAIADAGPYQYQLQKPRPAPVLGTYRDRINELLIDCEQQPRNQRYTARRIYRLIRAEGYQGSESTVRRYFSNLDQSIRQGSSLHMSCSYQEEEVFFDLG